MHLVAVHLLHLVTVLQSDAVFFESVCGIIATTMQQNIYRKNIWRAICVFNKHIFWKWAVSGWLVVTCDVLHIERRSKSEEEAKCAILSQALELSQETRTGIF